MATRRILLATLFFAAGTGIFFAKDNWQETDFRLWKLSTVARLLGDSPWAQTWVHKQEGIGQGLNEQEFTFTVRMLSSLPIRMGYVRMLELSNKYDNMSEDRKKDFDSRVDPILNANVIDEVVLTLAFSTNDQSARLDVKRFLDNATTQTLSQQAYLFSPGAGRVDLKNYIPPGNEALGARFIFPRSLNGKPLLQPGGKDLRFELYINPLNDTLRVGFDARKMIYKDKLDY